MWLMKFVVVMLILEGRNVKKGNFWQEEFSHEATATTIPQKFG